MDTAKTGQKSRGFQQRPALGRVLASRGGLASVCACVLALCGSQPHLPAQQFENPPLLYDGPDPTAGSFFPMLAMRSSEIRHLPPVEEVTAEPSVSGEMIPDSPSLSESIGPPVLDFPGEGFELPAEELPKLNEFKNGFFQRVSLTANWLPRGSGHDGFGITELDSFAMVAVPMPSREWPLVISPTFNMRLLDGPNEPDLPPRLFETYLDLVWVPRLSDRWTAIVSVAPSLYTDFEVDDSEAFRMTGRGLGRFDWVPDELQLLFGVLYLGRQDVRILPAGGIIWTPTVDRHYELVFPRPKLAHRIAVAPTYQDWLYLGSEFGGNSFAFDHDGEADIVTLRDYRVFLGLERKRDGGAGRHLEIGYVFSRTAEFASGLAELSSPATAMLRFGAAY